MGKGGRISSSEVLPFPALRAALEALLLSDPSREYGEVLRTALRSAAAQIAWKRGLPPRIEPLEGAVELPDLGEFHPRDLGSAYEAYLGFRPRIEEGRIHWMPDLDLRRRWGVYYTPPELVRETLEYALPRNAHGATVCDLACGCGAFLAAAATRLALDSGKPPLDVVKSQLYGCDLDPAAVEICRLALWLLSGCPPDETNIRCADSLTCDWPALFPEVFRQGGFDAVIGNPPFGGVVDGRVPPSLVRIRKERFPHLRGTADLSSYFLATAHRIAGASGRVALVMPRAFLSAHASASLRHPVGRRLTLERGYKGHSAFHGASVHVCVVGYEAGPSDQPERKPAQEPRELQVRASMTVGEAYEVSAHVFDGARPECFKLVTSGLIEPEASLWGEKVCRFLKRDYRQPCLACDSLPQIRRALAHRPKLLIAGLSQNIEAFLDLKGEFVGSVGTYTVTHVEDDAESLLRALHKLHSAPMQIRFHAELGPSALGGGNITVTKRFLQSALAAAGF